MRVYELPLFLFLYILLLNHHHATIHFVLKFLSAFTSPEYTSALQTRFFQVNSLILVYMIYKTGYLNTYADEDFCLIDLIIYVPSTIFQLYRDGSSWVEPVLS